MKLWFDVEDLYTYARLGSRPSGIQRLAFEIYRAAHETSNNIPVGFLRHDPLKLTLRTVSWEEFEKLYFALAMQPNVKSAEAYERPQPLRSTMSSIPGVRSFAGRLPTDLRIAIAATVRTQLEAARHFVKAVSLVPTIFANGRSAIGKSSIADGHDFRDIAQPGDILAAFGAPWDHPNYAKMIQALVEPLQLRFALLVYDLVPVLRPEFSQSGLAANYTDFMRSTICLADIVFSISDSTSRDIVSWAEKEKLTLKALPIKLPIGYGFSTSVPGDKAGLPPELAKDEYVLYVSTIEPRKNHQFAFRAWRRLMEEIHPQDLPTLVFAGQAGWCTKDLLHQLDNARWLDGRIMHVIGPSDAQLETLYRGAKFTIFPSFYEGWGLPVTEALAFGKLCIASNAASLPEAGGPYSLYHDPDDVPGAVALYKRAILDRSFLMERERAIRAGFLPLTWSQTAGKVFEALADMQD